MWVRDVQIRGGPSTGSNGILSMWPHTDQRSPILAGFSTVFMSLYRKPTMTQPDPSSRANLAPPLGPAAEKQRQLSHSEERVPAVSPVFGNRVQRYAVFHSDPFSTFPNTHRRARKMDHCHPANPGVLDVLHRDARPAMVFVLRIPGVEIGHTAQVLHAHLADSTGPGIC
jgi:hypothetical protein